MKSSAAIAKFHNRLKERHSVKNTPKWIREPKEYIQDRLFIRTKTKQVIPLRFNPIQEMYWEWKTNRDIILKPRQLGFSTLTIARFFECVINEENVTAVIIAHDSDSTIKMFQAVQLMYERLPEAKKEQLNNGRNKPKYGNRKEFFFAGNNSRIYVGTAGSDKFGRSQTINYLLCSEVAFWPNPEEVMTGLLQAVPIDGEIVIESTANGVGNYYNMTYEDAKKGKNNWKAHFYAWFQHPEYRMPLHKDESIEYDEDEKELVQKYKLTPEQIKWRRWKISEMPSKPDISKEDAFKQEYPANDLEAFLMTGTPVFDVKKVMNRIEYLEKLYAEKPPLRGDFIYDVNEAERITDSSIKFLPNKHGLLTIYEKPRPKQPSVVGGDIAEGGKDFSAGQTLNNNTGAQIAVWHGHMDTDLYAKQMYCLGRYYNDALLAIEVNFDMHPVKELRRLRYPRQYKREITDSSTRKKQEKDGFRTDRINRPVIIAELVAIVRDHIELINDIPTLKEMMNFVRNDEGKPEAMQGKHDDLIMALAIAYRARGQQMTAQPPKPELPGEFYTPGEREDLGGRQYQIRKVR